MGRRARLGIDSDASGAYVSQDDQLIAKAAADTAVEYLKERDGLLERIKELESLLEKATAFRVGQATELLKYSNAQSYWFKRYNNSTDSDEVLEVRRGWIDREDLGTVAIVRGSDGKMKAGFLFPTLAEAVEFWESHPEHHPNPIPPGR